MRFSSDCGPEISAHVTLLGGKIYGIELKNSQEGMGFSWEIASDNPKGKIEHDIYHWMEDYAKKKEPKVSLPLFYPKNFSIFSKNVLEKLKAVPFSKWMSYQELASKLGSSSKSRAVGGACGRNPFPLVIPCHRILGKGGRLGGFSSGLSIKEKLLRHEGISYAD